jgi:hypothetical protein
MGVIFEREKLTSSVRIPKMEASERATLSMKEKMYVRVI